MKGMHCPLCRDDGPDIVLNTNAPVGMHGEFEFRCEGCGNSWRWTFTSTRDGFVYTFGGAVDAVAKES